MTSSSGTPRAAPGATPDPRSITQLPCVVPVREPRPTTDNSAHPMRLLTEGIASDERAWTRGSARSTEHFFDELAPDWDRRFSADVHRLDPLRDALERGGTHGRGTVVDVGAGTASSSTLLQHHFDRVVALDLSWEMVRRASGVVPRLQADAARLPFADGTLDAVVLMNAFLFPAEVQRVLGPTGVVVWVSAIGSDTPIYLSADEVGAALPGRWDGVWSEAGDGSWAVLRRS